MDKIYLFFAANYFAQGLSGIAYEPVDYLLKDHLGLSAGQSAVFIAWMTLPFLIKPLFGLLTDLCPIGGRRRIPHIALASALAAAAWILLALRPRYSYGPVLALLFMANVGIAFSDVVCDAVMVEKGKELKKTAPYQAAQIGTLYLSLVLTGIGGGWLAAHCSYRWIFFLTSLFPILILASTFLLREDNVPPKPRPAWNELVGLVRQRRFWVLSLIIFLWNFYPFFGTVQFYYQSNVLHLGKFYIGTLSTLGGLAGVLGAAFFWKAHGKLWDADKILENGAWIGAGASLLYLFYLGPVSVGLVEIVFGFVSVVLRLGLMDLLARSCPKSAEATSFAVFMAFFSVAQSASNAVGGKLYDALLQRFAAQPHPPQIAALLLVCIGSACTLSCRWLAPALRQGENLPG